MNKIFLIFSREYLTRVKKKSFLITTILLPLVVILLYAGSIALMVVDRVKGKKKLELIAVVDEQGLFKGKIGNQSKAVILQLDSVRKHPQMLKSYQDLGFDAYLHIPPFPLDSPRHITLYSKETISMTTTAAIEDMINDAIVSKRLQALGMTEEKYKAIESEVSLDYRIESGEESRLSVPEIGYIVSYACGFLIYIMMLIYGTQVMRGVMEEKISRISEIMVSSVKPFQLMMGKILGIGAVGLTQFIIWIILIVTLQFSITAFMPDVTSTLASSGVQAQVEDVPAAEIIMSGIASLPIFKIVFCFIFYFLFGYLTYAAIFAAIGSAVSDDQQDAQQLMFPVMMPVIFSFIILSNAIDNPYSDLVVFGSYFPLTSPIVMMGRITFDIPWWQLLISMLLLAGCFVLMTWIASRIYRVGILMYGKKPTWKELIRWGFRKN